VDVYQQNILDHYRHPTHRGEIKDADRRGNIDNPSCGDSVRFHLKVDKNLVVQAKWQGEGCVLSQAAADLLAEYAEGKALPELTVLDKKIMLELVGLELGPNRLSCALLPLEALQRSLD